MELEFQIPKKKISDELWKIYSSDKTNDIFSFITPEERIQYQKKQFVFVDEQIYWDDTIEVVKLKISKYIENISAEEMYLFVYKHYDISPVFLYDVLSKNNTIDISQEKLEVFLKNLVSPNTFQPLPFEYSTDEIHFQYQDIIELNLKEKKYWLCSPLGQKYILKMDEFVFTTNPLEVEYIDPFTEREERKSMLVNSNLVLNSKNIIYNNIYLITTEEVLSYAETKLLNENLLIKLYFPYLFKQNITTKEQWLEEKENLLRENKKKINSSFSRDIENINMFYDIYKLRKTEIPYQSISIKNFKITLYQDNDIKLPLDILFKTFHSTLLNPLIKYNPSNKKETEDLIEKSKYIERRENIYRLYTDQLTEDGRKIPFLSKGTIFRLIRDIGKQKE